MSRERIETALRAMGERQPDRAVRARAVIDWLTAGEGIETIGLADVQRLAWYGLPVKWVDSVEGHAETLAAAVDLFDRLDLPRYAAVFGSPETTSIIAAYARSPSEGRRAFRAAHDASGIDPADLDDFVWGAVMGMEEVMAHGQAERALEEAMTTGSLNPGRAGWKGTARTVTARVLDSSHPVLPGQSWRTAILTERLDDWLRRAESRSAAAQALKSRHVNRLLEPVPVPVDAAERLAPVTWFLAHAAEGIRLTQAGYLPTALVQEAWERFDWDLRWTDRAPRSQSESLELMEIDDLLSRMGAVRRRKGRLGATPSGKRILDGTEMAWRAVAAGLSGGAWPTTVAETYTLLLLDGVGLDRDLEAQATAILAEMGWQTDGEPPDARTVMSTWYETRRPLAALGGVEQAGDWRASETHLTPFGEATLLEQVRVGAAGPRSTPW